MWDRDDHFGRWVQAICYIPLLLFFAFELYFIFSGSWYGIWWIIRSGVTGSAGYLAYRCLRYAITGNGNINRDSY